MSSGRSPEEAVVSGQSRPLARRVSRICAETRGEERRSHWGYGIGFIG